MSNACVYVKIGIHARFSRSHKITMWQWATSDLVMHCYFEFDYYLFQSERAADLFWCESNMDCVWKLLHSMFLFVISVLEFINGCVSSHRTPSISTSRQPNPYQIIKLKVFAANFHIRTNCIYHVENTFVLTDTKIFVSSSVAAPQMCCRLLVSVRVDKWVSIW